MKTIGKLENNYGEIIISKKNNNNMINLEEYNAKKIKTDIIKKLKKSEEEIERGDGIESDVAFKELRHKYGYWKIQGNNNTNSI